MKSWTLLILESAFTTITTPPTPTRPIGSKSATGS
ncbi:Uncharacterised protein [Bordetella pertussis]|nr:Uncharacterised protein [Bordetella pertussis]CFP58726.1 Uncharacterised protein [Bordetella pertussis]